MKNYLKEHHRSYIRNLCSCEVKFFQAFFSQLHKLGITAMIFLKKKTCRYKLNLLINSTCIFSLCFDINCSQRKRKTRLQSSELIALAELQANYLLSCCFSFVCFCPFSVTSVSASFESTLTTDKSQGLLVFFKGGAGAEPLAPLSSDLAPVFRNSRKKMTPETFCCLHVISGFQ